ncbi:MAG: AAA family ATPase [Chlamydiales bacterium]|nr:AAA family ATPase [Chlamydiales bacterium]
MNLPSIPSGFSSCPPSFQKAIDAGHLDPIDLFIAKRMLVSTDSLEVEAFLALMVHDFRQGNLYYPTDLLDSEEGELYELARKGKELLPEKLVAKNGESLSKLICKTPQGFYFQKNYLFETRTLHHIQRLINRSPPPLKRNREPIDGLNPEQLLGIDLSLASSFSIITGGPGTGKTFTAKHLIKQRLLMLSLEEREKFQIVLAAPTGKAIAHLEKQIFPFLEEGEKKQIQSGTLHALLQLREDGLQKRKVLLPCNLLLVDECSMIDAYLFQKLLEAIPLHTQVILLGDRNQLPAVGSGNFFADLIDAKLPQTHLMTTCRTENVPLKHFADSLFSQDLCKIKEELPLFQIPSEEPLLPLLYKRSRNAFPCFFDTFPEADALLPLLNRFRILSCLRKGDLGVDAINRSLIASFEADLPSDGWWAIPIMITSNDYRSELYNGDVGILVRKITDVYKKLPLGKEDYALFEGREKIPAFALPPFEYAYCLSVHKSQGSEYEEILLVVPEGSEKFGREILYTAVTRARQKLQIHLDEKTFQAMLAKSSKKRSYLKERILLSTDLA